MTFWSRQVWMFWSSRHQRFTKFCKTNVCDT